MGAAECIDASKLRMSSFRFAKMFLDIPHLERMGSGGHISLNTGVNVELRQENLVVTTKLTALIRLQGEESEDGEDSPTGRIEIVGVAGYDLPESQNLTEEAVENIESGQVEKFVHMLEPIMMLKLRSMLSDAGARGVNIPPHVYVPDSTELERSNAE